MYNKKYLDNNNLLISMKNKKIKISNDKEALKFLEQVNYSKLKEYLYYFDKDNKNFNNKDFKEIIDLYNFDKMLRIEINSCIEILEIYIKNNMIKILGENDPFAYLNQNSFFNGFNFSSHINDVNDIIINNRNKSSLMITFFNKYKSETRLPIWIIIEFFTLGKIINLYNFLKIKDKKKMANLIDKNLDFKDLNSWLANILILRNFCSHNNRVWNRNFKPLANIPNNINNRTMFAEVYMIYRLLKILGRENEIRRLRKECKKFFRKYPYLMNSFGISNLKELNILKF